MSIKQAITLLLLYCSIATQLNYAKTPCMTISQELKEPNDPKRLHYVACTCPCERYKQIANRNQCTKCGHFHDIAPYIIISKKDHLNAEETRNCVNQRRPHETVN